MTTSLDVRPSYVDDATPPPRPLPWIRAIALHLLPGVAAFGVTLALEPLFVHRGLPSGFAMTVAFLISLTPIELGILLVAAHRATGRWSLAALPAVLSYRRPLRRWWLLVAPLFGVAVAVQIALTPVADRVGGWLPGVWPAWLRPDYDATRGFSTTVLVTTLLITLLVDGVVNPIVEELYFRAYLLPRLPLARWAAVPVSAGLFAMQHYWQPYNWLLIFVLQLILTALVVRLRSVRLGMVMHVLANCFGVGLTLITVLT